MIIGYSKIAELKQLSAKLDLGVSKITESVNDFVLEDAMALLSTQMVDIPLVDTEFHVDGLQVLGLSNPDQIVEAVTNILKAGSVEFVTEMFLKELKGKAEQGYTVYKILK